MEVFRVENEKGYGPYCGSAVANGEDVTYITIHGGVETPETVSENHPLPKAIHRYHIFGFKDLEQLKNWFSKQDRSKLNSLGFKLAIYDTDTVKFEESQVQFVPKNRQQLNSLLDL